MLNKKVSEIVESGSQSVLELQSLLSKKIEQNTSDFFQNIKTKEYQKAQKNIDWGLNWKSKETLMELSETLQNSFENINIIKILWDLKPNDIPNEIVLDFFKSKENLKTDDVIKEIFKKRIKKGFYPLLSEDVGLWLIDKINIFSVNEKFFIEEIIKSVLKSDIQKYERLLDTIYLKDSKLITDLLNIKMSEDNFKFVIKKYSFLLNKITNPIDIEKIMYTALEKGNLNIIRFLNKEGQSYPDSKAAYAGLFGNINNKDAMEYVINTIEDITVGNQVILKTALHYNRKLIIVPILERYDQQQFENISKAMEKRPESESLEIIKYFILKNNLEVSLGSNNNNNKSCNKI